MIKKISVLIIVALTLFTISNTKVYAASTDISGPSVIHKEKNQVFTIGDLLKLYDNDVFIDEDNFTGYGNVPGEYIITLIQGFETKDVTIVVVEDWKQLSRSNDILFVTDYKNIYVSNNRNLTLYETIYYIYDTTGYVETDYQFRYEELLDEYHSSFEDGIILPGSYQMIFRLTYFSGLQSTYSVSIHTIEIQELAGIILEAPPNTMDKIMSKLPWLLGIGVAVYLLTHIKKKRGFSL